MIEGRFGDMERLVATATPGPIAGVALDLGVSSMQLDAAERGFSFRLDGPLDMRMGAEGESAADLVARLSEGELAELIRSLGEERFARRVARAIVAARQHAPICRTGELAEIVRAAIPTREPGLDPATRTFQALRIAVNDELGELDRGLAAAERLLMPGGRLAVVSFHSLEDARVKSSCGERSGARGGVAPCAAARGRGAAEFSSARAAGGAAGRGRDRAQPARPLGAAAGGRAHCGAAVGERRRRRRGMRSAGGQGMTRLGVVFWGGLVLASGFATFKVKYAVQGIDDELARVRRQTVAEQQEIRVLTAEWAYLNQPERLAELNRRFLQLAPMTAKQLQGRIEEIALRAPPAGFRRRCSPRLPAANPPAATSAAASPVPPAPLHRRACKPAARPPRQTAEAPAGMTRSADVQGTAPKGAEAPAAGTSADGAIALAEAQRLLGIDAGGQSLRARLAKVAPIAAAQAAEAPVADAASGGTRPADASAEGAAALAEALHVLGSDGGGQTPRVRLAKAAPASLDALISQIADTR